MKFDEMKEIAVGRHKFDEFQKKIYQRTMTFKSNESERKKRRKPYFSVLFNDGARGKNKEKRLLIEIKGRK